MCCDLPGLVDLVSYSELILRLSLVDDLLERVRIELLPEIVTHGRVRLDSRGDGRVVDVFDESGLVVIFAVILNLFQLLQNKSAVLLFRILQYLLAILTDMFSLLSLVKTPVQYALHYQLSILL